MRKTVALQGSSYDLGSDEAAEIAQAWLRNHIDDVDGFKEEFPGAQVVASIGGHHKQPPDPAYYVFGSASDHGKSWMPSARVVFAFANGQTGTALRDLPQLGTFRTDSEAMDTARKAKVAEIRSNGTVIFECERK